MTSLLDLDAGAVTGLNTWVGNVHTLSFLMRLIALYGVYIVPVVFVLRWFWVGRREREFMLSAMLAGAAAWWGFNSVLKLLFFRERPLTELPVKEILFERPGNSFPSDHVAFLAGLAFFYLLNRSKDSMGRSLFILAVLVGFARIAVAVHYPTDILAGFFSGLLSAWVVTVLHSWLVDSLWDRVIRFATRLRLA